MPDTLELWLGHSLKLGLTMEEMAQMREKLDELRGVKKIARRADGTPRRRTLAPPPRPARKG